MSFFWYSFTGESEAWKSAVADQRARVISELKPAFVTVLDAEDEPQNDWDRAQYLKQAYNGPLYFDWDADDINDSITDLKLFLLRLQDDLKFNLYSARIFATGGRGFHVEIPLQAMMAKVPPKGVPQLPSIYREMALELATENMDLRIYSLRRGRMWRVPNLERTNGKYKVPITVTEALEMTPELYEELTSAPRYYSGDPASRKDSPWLYAHGGALPAPLEPELTLDLQAMFASKRSQVDNSIKRQMKVKDERAQLARFKGAAPEGLKTLMRGERLRSDAGFNDIALQLAIAGAALGMSESEFMTATEGFVQNHDGDGSRYNTPRKRSEALRDRFHYVSESPVYVFTMSGLRSICEAGYLPSDLFGGEAGGLYSSEDPDEFYAREDGRASLPPEVQAEMQLADSTARQGIFMRDGIYQRGDTIKTLSTLSFGSPVSLIDLKNGQSVGYEATIRVRMPTGEARSFGRHSVNASDFNSRATLDALCHRYHSFYLGSDIGATIVRSIIQDMTIKADRMQYVLTREGMELIEDPTLVGPGDKPVLMWSTANAVLTPGDVLPDSEIKPGSNFTFRPRLSTNTTMHLNAHTYPVPEATPEFAAWLEQVLKINTPAVVATMFGWFVSCFHRQLHHHVHNEYPIAHVYGAAGSGKSTMPHLFIRMFTSSPPGGWEHAGIGMTRFAWQVLTTRSSSMPAVLDEFKRSAFHEKDYQQILQELRVAYNQGMIGRGGVSDGSAKADYREINQFTRSTPLMLLGETLIEETATRDRVVPIAVSKEGQGAAAWAVATSTEGLEYMTRLGSLLIRRTLAMDVDKFKADFIRTQQWVKERTQPVFDNRPVNNYTAVIMGLDFLAESLREGIGLDADSWILPLKEQVITEGLRQAKVTPITPNALKTMIDIAYITRTEEPGSRWEIKEGVHYIVNGEEGWMDIDMGATYRVYADYARSRGMDVHFGSVEAFCAGLAVAPSITLDTECVNSPLRRWAATTIFRFSVTALTQKGVEPFKSIAMDKTA